MLHFAKYHGAGNDFVLIDARQVSLQWETLAQRICERKTGIGADGLLLLLPSSTADFRMRIFNADGSEPAMCGNGIRCIVDFIHTLEQVPDTLRIETLAGVFTCTRAEGEVAINLGVPKILHWPIVLPHGKVFVVDTGVPHAVVLVDDIEKTNVEKEGRILRFHEAFAPHGVNVNFASITSDKITVRTYERGVEGETLSCGTGCAAVAFVAKEFLKIKDPISVSSMRFSFADGQIHMLGPIYRVFDGMMQF
jgi:diaminopimelate epimerase